MRNQSGSNHVVRAAALGLIAAMGLATGSVASAGEMVAFENEMGETTRGYLAIPEGATSAPGILVIHEWWGLTDWVKQNVDRFAEQGYAALAVDLYDGKSTDDPGEAHELMRAVDQGEAIADMKGGLAYLRSRKDVAIGPDLGVIGWCMGGGFARLIAQNAGIIGPTVICYGSISTEPDQVQALSGKSILGIFGARDRGIPAEKVKEFAEKAEEAGASVELHIYENAGHAFMRPGGNQYVEDAAKKAWAEIDEFFATHLKAGGSKAKASD